MSTSLLLAALALLFAPPPSTTTVEVGWLSTAICTGSAPLLYQQDGHLAARASATVHQFDPAVGVLDSVTLTYWIPVSTPGMGSSTAHTSWAWENLSAAPMLDSQGLPVVHYLSKVLLCHSWQEPTSAWPLDVRTFARAELDWFLGYDLSGVGAFDGSVDCAGTSGFGETRWWGAYSGMTPPAGARQLVLPADPRWVGTGTVTFWLAPRLVPYDGASVWNDPLNGATTWHHGLVEEHHEASLVLEHYFTATYASHAP